MEYECQRHRKGDQLMDPHQTTEFDALVIGAGVIGAAIARELSAYDLRVGIVDTHDDVAEGTSKANTAILHTGYDAKPGTLESELVHEGYQLLRDYCDETEICYETTGAILVAWTDEQLGNLPSLQEKAQQNGYAETKIIPAAEVYSLVPSLGKGAKGGLVVPGESIIDAWTVPLAFATDAIRRGARFFRNRRVTGIHVGADTTTVSTTGGDISTRWVVNAAGIGTDEIDRFLGFDRIHNHPRRGQLIVYDKLSSALANRIILPVPSKLGKGVLISPTIFGNVMLGPTAEDMEDRSDTSTTQEGIDFLLEKGRAIMPALLQEEVTSMYSGLRAAHDQSDYLIEADAHRRYLIAGAIRSTGLTSSMAVARHVKELLNDAGLKLSPRASLPPAVHMPKLGQRSVRPYQDAEKINNDPEYGHLVCFCERVTRGEIRDAMNSELPPDSLAGLRRRTRAMNGRCQAFFCGAEVQAMFESMKQGKTE
jgi:glycerol-3-phosphate dehydrogenase